MRTLFKGLLILICFSLLKISAFAGDDADAVIGVWLTQDKDSKVRIYKKNNKFYGKIIWLKEPNRNGKPKVDDKNPDEKKKDRPIMGMVLMRGFVYDDDLEWEDGKIYDPKSGSTYSCNMELSDDKNTLEVRGYIGVSLFGRTAVWTRSEE